MKLLIPNNNDNLKEDFEKEIQPTKTYFLNTDNNTITGYCDGKDAMKQAIYKILNTERYDYLIYSWNYRNRNQESNRRAIYICDTRA